MLSDAREGIGLREDTHFELVRTMPAVRRAVLEMGRRMALQGAIDEPEDAWFLVWSEVDRLPDPANHPVDGSLRDAIARLSDDNAQGELYLTDVVDLSLIHI